jgi:hypothetical protein
VASARFVPRWEVADVAGAVVAVDVIRAFTTAAYAFAAGFDIRLALTTHRGSSVLSSTSITIPVRT